MAKTPEGMECSRCSGWVEQVGDKCVSVICSDCVQQDIPAPSLAPPIQRLSYEEKKERKEARAARKKAKLEAMKTKTRGKGKGWHLKKVFAFEGQYFSFGKEITPEAAAKLMKELKKDEGKMKPTKRGTLKPKSLKRKRRKRV